jgi:hypothetical protein
MANAIHISNVIRPNQTCFPKSLSLEPSKDSPKFVAPHFSVAKRPPRRTL